MKMGCVNSKSDINDTHPNIFNVININDRGKPVSRGKLEVFDLISSFRHSKFNYLGN